jgi:hypothetical protein
MKPEIVDKAIALKQQIQFATNQVDALRTTMITLERRKDLKDAIRLDLSIYSHNNILLCKAAIPSDLLGQITNETYKHWEDIKSKAETELAAL